MFPVTLDDFTPKVDNTNDVMAQDVNELQGAIESIESKLGITNSTDENSLDYKTTNPNRFNGACQIPSLTDNGNGSVTLGSGMYCLSVNATGAGAINKYTLAGGLMTLTDNAVNYIVANYNSGTPILEVITDVTLINETTIVPVYTIFRNGIYLHIQNWDALSLALANKIHQSIVKTQRYRRESGLTLSESGTRNLNVTTGRIWVGAVPITLDAIATATDNMFLWYHVGGVWTQSIIAQYNNTQYDNGTDLVTLSNGKYAVSWVFRGVESGKHLYIVLGAGDYTLAEAQEAVLGGLPTAISSHAVLIGKVIVAKSAATATVIQSAFDTQFSTATPNSHNDLIGLQGGVAGEYYHLTSAQLAIVNNTSGTNSGNETTTTIGALINGATAKTTPVDADMVGLMDSAASNILKKLSWANIKATLKTYFDTLYQAAGSFVPTTRSLTIGGVTYDLSADRTWAGGGLSYWTAITGTRTANNTITVAGDQTILFKKGTIIRWQESGVDKWGYVSIPSTFSSVTTITFIGCTCASIDSNSFKYSNIVSAVKKPFAYAGAVGATGTDVANAWYADKPYNVFGAELSVGSAGTTNSTTIDLNKNGTSMFTTKPTLASTVAFATAPFTADTAMTLALGDKVTKDIDAVQTTPAQGLYSDLLLLETRYLSLT